jgi:hypothetical protein
MDLHFHSSSTLSWYGAQLKHSDNFTLPYLTLPYINRKVFLVDVSYCIYYSGSSQNYHKEAKQVAMC